MAKMIPPECDEQTSSAAERRVFNLLRHDPATQDWMVLHSLGLANTASKPYGEVDFVVLTPNGAVVCLEVKGGRVTCEEGIWYTTDRQDKVTTLKRSPFMQARDGMFALMNAVQQRFGKGHAAGACLYGYAVVFSDVSAPPQTPEFEPWEVIGRDELRRPISQSVIRTIEGQRKKFGTRIAPDAATTAIAEIRQFLRPDFERVLSRPATIRNAEQDLLSLTEDQFEVLDVISGNARCLVEGAAGTGKTVLALEYARRSAKSGLRTLLLCFNRLLGDWFASEVRSHNTGLLKAGSYFHFLYELIAASSYRTEFAKQEKENSEADLFAEVFPLFGLLAAEEGPQYDRIVIDEAQDLLNPPTLDVVGALLKGGLAGGSWSIFGDFTRQSIYGGPSKEERVKLLESLCPHFANAKLLTNCRNTRRIGEETALLSGFPSPPYRLGQVDGLPVDYRYWNTEQREIERLAELLKELLEEGLDPKDLVILSPRRFAESIASRVSCPCRLGTVIAREIRPGGPPLTTREVGFATIQAFKGMESSSVIICDIDQVSSEGPQALLYVGMSRARSHLAMIVHEGVQETIAQALLRKLDKEWAT